MFGKRDQVAVRTEQAPPPVSTGAPAIATRPQRIEPANGSAAPAASATAAAPAAPAKAAGPKATSGLDQLRAAQGAPPTTQVVREQSDYYHATKTTIFNALLNT